MPRESYLTVPSFFYVARLFFFFFSLMLRVRSVFVFAAANTRNNSAQFPAIATNDSAINRMSFENATRDTRRYNV